MKNSSSQLLLLKQLPMNTKPVYYYESPIGIKEIIIPIFELPLIGFIFCLEVSSNKWINVHKSLVKTKES